MVDLKILQSGWLRTFWTKSQEPEFFLIWDLCRNTANNIKFHYRTKSVKIKHKIFQYIQKNLFLTHFWPIFQIFWAKKMFLKNPALNLEKTNDTIPRKRLDRWKDRRKDRQTDPIS